MTSNIASGSLILTREGARRKLRRMAFQIAENNESESALVIAGIAGNGTLIAEKLVAELATDQSGAGAAHYRSDRQKGIAECCRAARAGLEQRCYYPGR
jgi:pyrimidine operon attenuation protein/uracil phosphoribosyltransferase